MAALRDAVAAGELDVVVPDAVDVERPRNREHGDWATTAALRLAKEAGRPPREIAGLLAARLGDVAGVASVDVAGPGFLNVRLEAGAGGATASAVVAAGRDYGRGQALAGSRVDVEFVSANPTGPLHVGHVRWAAVGDALARVLAAAGADVAREYYLNDAGVQVDTFAGSLRARARGEDVPEGGYPGQYVVELAARICAEQPGLAQAEAEQALPVFRREGLALQVASIRASLERIGVRFDVWTSEQGLRDAGALEAGVERLRAQGHVYEDEGALWLRTSTFGDDKDRVLVRSDGEPTYFCADVAYYLDKRERGFDRLLYLLGADHHGYIGRLRAVAAAAGDDPAATVDVLLGQLVNVLRDGRPVKQSKRAGEILTLDELVDLVGVDALRYSLARTSSDTTLDLDVDLVTRRTSDNPVFYVQYAHARIASLLREAEARGVALDREADTSLLVDDTEGELLAALAELPEVVATAARLRAPHRVARYLEERVAPTYHRFYDACPVLPPKQTDPALAAARLLLCEATRQVLANGLDLLGVSAPERM